VNSEQRAGKENLSTSQGRKKEFYLSWVSKASWRALCVLSLWLNQPLTIINH